METLKLILDQSHIIFHVGITIKLVEFTKEPSVAFSVNRVILVTTQFVLTFIQVSTLCWKGIPLLGNVLTVADKKFLINIIDYIFCFTTTHFVYDQDTITQTVSPFSSTSYVYNFEITCYIMIVAVLEIIYIYQSYRTFIEFIILKCIFYYYTLNNSLDNNQCI